MCASASHNVVIILGFFLSFYLLSLGSLLILQDRVVIGFGNFSWSMRLWAERGEFWKEIWNSRYNFLGVVGGVWRWLCRHLWRKISAHVDGGLSGGSSRNLVNLGFVNYCNSHRNLHWGPAGARCCVQCTVEYKQLVTLMNGKATLNICSWAIKRIHYFKVW
jgi:hypothetical protein